MELCLRGTFIDVVQPFDQPARRSRSVPPPRSPLVEHDAHIREKEYVESISLWMMKIEPLPAVSEMRLTAESLMMLPEKKKRVNDVNFSSVSTTASSAPRADSPPAYLFDDDSDSECDDPGSKESLIPPPPNVGIGVTESLVPPPPTYCNTGSLGHPELCKKPCLFFSGGRCDSKTTCGYCHYDHDKRPVHLDKRNRTLLKDLSFADCNDMFIPILEERANLIGMDASKIFATLLSSQDKATPGLANRRRPQALIKTMRSMSFRRIVAVLIGRPDAPAALDGGVISDMLDELRIPRT